MSNKLPPIESLSSAPHAIQQVLDTLFEPAPALYPLVASQLPRQFTSYDQFVDFVASLLFSLTRDRDGNGDDTEDSRLQEILSAHPRLGETNIHSALSRAEQTSLATAAAEGDEAAQLRRLNERYEQTFPGRYIHPTSTRLTNWETGLKYV